ncbi:DUF4214 domain-containing protein [Sulfitobacter sp. 1A12779]|uniref:DUF4214 domain-containing protein n=1 Tax=Sulfitobacter sp. 1A12779 TaxID=3368599 RepID=UPI003746D02A
MATTAQVDAIVALYAGYFNRAPDPAGLQFWIDQIDGGREFNTIAADFAASPEATALYPYLTTPDVASPSTFITNVYQNLFNRAPDAEGLQFWTDVLNEGSVSVADMIEAIINGAVDAPDATPPTFDASTLENKIEVGRDFAADAANTTGFVFDDAAKSAAIDVIDGVTSDDATVDAAKAETDAFLEGATNPGNTFTLTTGADVVAGTAGNDTINALPVNAAGDATTFSAFDDIDGGAGTDTLNIFTSTNDDDDTFNGGFPTGASVTNVEIVNINNAQEGGFGDVDASDFEGATQIWQVENANDIEGLAASTTAGFRDTATGTFGVAAAAGVASVAIALDNAEASTFEVEGNALNSVTVSGTVEDDEAIELNVAAGKDVQAVSVSSAVDATLEVSEGVTSVDASAGAGDISYDADEAVAAIKTGMGADDVTINTATSNTAGATVSAMLETGAGNDAIAIDTNGTGTTSVDAGAGNDTVTLESDGSGKLTVALGEGDDAFLVGENGVVSKGDVIDGGAGIDTVQVKDIGSANIGAFTNFEIFDAIGLDTTLDTDILALNNTVTEFVASGSVNAGAALTNVAAGVGVRVTGDMDDNALSIGQKAAGSLTVTLDIDEDAENAMSPAVSGNVNATNATSVEAVFDSSFVGEPTALEDGEEIVAGDNVAELELGLGKATSLSVNSGGDVAVNNLIVEADDLTSVTVTGDQLLNLDVNLEAGAEVTSVDASASTGGLIFDMEDLANSGSVSLGSGKDTILVDASSAADADGANAESIVGFEKADAAAVGTNETAQAAAIADSDLIDLRDFDAVVANANGDATGATLENGVLTFDGTGPQSLDAAALIADAFAETAGEAVLFEYIGDSYVFVQGGTTGETADALSEDTMVKLTGVTDVTNLVETGTDQFFIV